MVRRSPAGNVAAKWLIEGSGRIFNVLLAVLGARWLGPELWGQYWSAFGIAQIAATGSDLGGHIALTRMTATSPGMTGVWIRSGAAIKLGLTLVSMIAGTALLLYSSFSPWFAAMLITTALLVSWCEWLGAWMRGLGRVAEEAALLAIHAVAACTLGLVALSRSPRPSSLAASQLIAAAAIMASAAWIFRKRLHAGTGSGWLAAMPSMWKRAWPVGLSILVSMFSWRLFYLFAAEGRLAVLAYDGEQLADAVWGLAGHYGAAHRLLEAARFLPAAAAAALLPSLAARTRPLAPQDALRWLLPVSIVVPALAAIPGASAWLMAAVFGGGYSTDGQALSILSSALPFMTVTGVLTHWLIAAGHERWLIPLMLLHLLTHALGLLALPAQLGLTSHGSPHILGSPLAGPSVFALALVFAEAVLAAGTLLVWRRLR